MINLRTCTTPNGVACQAPGIRPDTAPICPIIDRSSRHSFVTLRGGGMFVVDAKATPMQIVGEYDMGTVFGNGCGGVDSGSAMFINSGGGTASNLDQFDLYRFPLGGYSATNAANTPAPKVVFRDNTPHRDAHGMVLTKHARHLWVLDRHDNVAEIFDAESDAHLGTLDLRSSESADPSPDLIDISPSGNRLFVSMRGPLPLSGDPHASTGSTPGLMVIQVNQSGAGGQVKSLVRIHNVDAGGVERADAHGIRVRRK